MESIADRRADMLAKAEEGAHPSAGEEIHELRNDRLLGVPVEYTRALDKVYRFIRMVMYSK